MASELAIATRAEVFRQFADCMAGTVDRIIENAGPRYGYDVYRSKNIDDLSGDGAPSCKFFIFDSYKKWHRAVGVRGEVATVRCDLILPDRDAIYRMERERYAGKDPQWNIFVRIAGEVYHAATKNTVLHEDVGLLVKRDTTDEADPSAAEIVENVLCNAIGHAPWLSDDVVYAKAAAEEAARKEKEAVPIKVEPLPVSRPFWPHVYMAANQNMQLVPAT